MRTSEEIREKLNSNVRQSDNRIVELKDSLIKDISDLQNVIYFTAGEKKIIKK